MSAGPGRPPNSRNKARYTHLKVSTHNKLYYLPDDRKELLHTWLKSPLPYTEVVQRMLEKWGVQTTPTSLSIYYRRFVASEMLEQRAKASGVAEEISEAINRKPGSFARAIYGVLAYKTFELLRDEADAKLTKIFFDMYKTMRDQMLRERLIVFKERQLMFLEKQAEVARQTSLDSQLSDAQKAERLQHIFRVPLLTDERLPSEAQLQAHGYAGNGFAS